MHSCAEAGGRVQTLRTGDAASIQDASATFRDPALSAAQCLCTQCRCQALHILVGTQLRALATPWDMLVAH